MGFKSFMKLTQGSEPWVSHPGPWKHDGPFIVDRNGAKICTISTPPPGIRKVEWRRENDLREGSARLMVNAPDMWLALMLAEARLSALTLGGKNIPWQDELNRIRKVLGAVSRGPIDEEDTE